MESTYKYIIASSMIFNHKDEYCLSMKEYNVLHEFFITYSMCKNSSFKTKTFTDYGWSSDNISKAGCLEQLSNILLLDKNKNFLFYAGEDIKQQFNMLNLLDEFTNDIDTERAVIKRTFEENNYFRLFNRIRNALAHGNYKLVYSSKNEKMIIIQDNDRYNVTARIVIKLNTIFELIKVIDKNNIFNLK